MIKNILLRFLLVLLSATLILFDCVVVNVVQADDNIGALNTTKYNDFSKLCKELKKNYEGKSVTIEMYCDWDYNKDHQFDERLYIPEDCNATLNMHGHRFDRDDVHDDDYSNSGELIFVDSGATLTINGASTEKEKQTEHTGVRVFTDINQKYANSFITTYGGTLSGGNSKAGAGGIYINSGKSVTLNDVTIAGCKGSYFWNPFVTFTGYGGGIIIGEKGTTLTLNNSTITGCLAQEDGGGIYARNKDNVHVILNNSHVDKNYAESDGGGINLDGENVGILAYNESTISNNKCAEFGGGVYLWNDEASLEGHTLGSLTIDGNQAQKGGGVYTMEEDVLLKNLIITNNTSTEIGGGIFVDNDNTTIENCTITGNNKYGVYMDSWCDVGMYIKGRTTIKDNTGGNLTLQNNTNYLLFDNVENMEVHMGYVENTSWSRPITKDGVKDYTKHLTADDDRYTIVYTYKADSLADDGSRLWYKLKEDVIPGWDTVRNEPEVIEVKTQQAHSTSDESKRVFEGGYTQEDGVYSGTEYELRTIYTMQCSIGDKNFKTYYSDGFFFQDPVIYNDHLATASYALGTTGAYLNNYTYDYKHAGARQYMADIGCPDQRIYINDSNTMQPGTDSIGVTIASKKLQQYGSDGLEDTGYTLIAIATRGANYEKEWASNVTLDYGNKRDGEARGFSEAADQVMEALDYYIEAYGLKDEIQEGSVKFWIAGFSRGGATANIVSKRVLEKYCYKVNGENQPATGNEVFAYPLEAPKGGTDKAEKLEDKTKYYSIHNLVNNGDVVIYVGPEEMGFKRYGVDHYMPGEAIGRNSLSSYLGTVISTTKTYTNSGEEVNVTTYRDNEPLATKGNKIKDTSYTNYDQYVTRRKNVIDHLAAIDHEKYFFDYFYPYATGPDVPPYAKIGLYQGAKLEDYIPNLFAFAQQETFENNYRQQYVDKFQALARAQFAQEKDPEAKKRLDALIDAAKKLFNVVDGSLLFNVIGDYYDLDQKGKEYVWQYLWDTGNNSGCFDELSSEDLKLVRENWNTIADAVFNFTDGDWNLGDNGQGDPTFPAAPQWINGKYGSESGGDDSWLLGKLIYSLTLMQNATMMIDNNHDREIATAWCRTYDSYYSSDTTTGQIKDEEFKEYSVNWVIEENNPDQYFINDPDAYIKDAREEGGYKALVKADQYPYGTINEIDASQKIILEVGKLHEDVAPANINQDRDVEGEAIYYQIDGFDTNYIIVPTQIYRGGARIPVNEPGTTYVLKTYARSYGLTSEDAVYYIKINDGHQVTVQYNSSGEQQSFRYKVGDFVSVSAIPQITEFFTNWKVSVLNNEGAVVEPDVSEQLMGSFKYKTTGYFYMPEVSDTYPNGYSLLVVAECKDMIEQVTTSLKAPVPETGEEPGVAIEKSTTLEFDNEALPKDVSVAWTYTYEDVTYPATDTVYSGVEYTATIKVSKSQAENIVFAPQQYLSLKYLEDIIKVKEGGIKIEKNDSDGGVTITIEFVETPSGGTLPPEAEVSFKIKVKDLNLGRELDYIEPIEYLTKPGEIVTIIGPDVKDEIFFVWDFTDADGIDVSEPGQDLNYNTIDVLIPDHFTKDDIVVWACYIPVIKTLEGHIEVPVGGQTMQTEADENTLKVTITNTYEIHPDYVDIIWSPSPKEDEHGNKIADYLVNYNATISLAPKEDEHGPYIYARLEGTDEYLKTSALFVYSESVSASINGEEAILDQGANSISFNFPLTTYKVEKVYTPDDVTGIPYGSSDAEILNAMPDVDILLDDGSIVRVEADWSDLEIVEYLDPYSFVIYKAKGNVKKHLPYGVVEKYEGQDLTVTGRAITDAADTVEKAIPSVAPGVYQEDVDTTLSSETDGAIIYWTTDPDIGECDPPDLTAWTTYEGENIRLDRNIAQNELDAEGNPTGRKVASLYVYTYKEGMRPDGPRKHAYIFTETKEIPKTNDSIYDGEPHIGVYGKNYYQLVPLSEDVEIDQAGNAVASKEGTHFVKAVINDDYAWEIDKEIYTADDQILSFVISKTPKKEFTIIYDLNGGYYRDKAGIIIEYYDKDEIMLIHAAPVRAGYEFVYWKGSEYQPGDKYTVTEDHTFTAVWRPEVPYNPPRTGDE